jgi:ketosteroid isomerase-like protein
VDTNAEVAQVAAEVRTALESADLDAFADLLDPNVTWGAPGDPTPPCQNRNQVLDWYRQGRAEGRRAHVLDVTSHRDKILVTMKVTDRNPPPTAGEHDRWQVLTVAGGRIVDIRGYDDQPSAAAAAGIST